MSDTEVHSPMRCKASILWRFMGRKMGMGCLYEVYKGSRSVGSIRQPSRLVDGQATGKANLL